MTSRKKSKRDRAKYPNLRKELNARTRAPLLDFDYLKQLNHEEKAFLNKVMGEYMSGSFKKDKNGEYSQDNLHKTSEQRKEIYNNNNARNRCMVSVLDAKGYREIHVDAEYAIEKRGESIGENEYIEYMDKKKLLECALEHKDKYQKLLKHAKKAQKLNKTKKATNKK